MCGSSLPCWKLAAFATRRKTKPKFSNSSRAGNMSMRQSRCCGQASWGVSALLMLASRCATISRFSPVTIPMNLRKRRRPGFFRECAPVVCLETRLRRISRSPNGCSVWRFLSKHVACATRPTPHLKLHMNSNSKINPRYPELTRRQFIRKASTSAALGSLFAGLPKAWVGSVYASDAPETATVKFGMIALTDCSPIVIAHEKGLFKKYGIDSVIAKGANWAAIRDSLSSGDLQATHMLLGMPIASTMALLASPKRPMVIPWLLNRNGQAISLKAEWKGKVPGDPKALKPMVDKAKSLGEPLTFAMTFPPGTHAMWTRYYL